VDAAGCAAAGVAARTARMTGMNRRLIMDAPPGKGMTDLQGRAL
jgi:hypothetical protein